MVIFGLRSDFYTQCATHPRLLEAVEGNQVIVGPLSRAGPREAILHPARAVGLEVEPGLVQSLLRDLGAPAPDHPHPGTDEADAYEIGRLPLLAHALRVTWLRRAGHVLTVDGYESTGGIAHSVTAEADRRFDGLYPHAQRTAQSEARLWSSRACTAWWRSRVRSAHGWAVLAGRPAVAIFCSSATAAAESARRNHEPGHGRALPAPVRPLESWHQSLRAAARTASGNLEHLLRRRSEVLRLPRASGLQTHEQRIQSVQAKLTDRHPKMNVSAGQRPAQVGRVGLEPTADGL
ncbi:hypothetical protein ACIQRF_06245 [Streptomyces avermitilis]|uniref:nSTAND1 domain-containing NTPase n=1 Tax=Streptomyces avermitilis TaxID=33903 RepID=UPI0034E2E865